MYEKYRQKKLKQRGKLRGFGWKPNDHKKMPPESKKYLNSEATEKWKIVVIQRMLPAIVTSYVLSYQYNVLPHQPKNDKLQYFATERVTDTTFSPLGHKG